MVFTPSQLEKYAAVLLWGLETARPGFKRYDVVLLRTELEAMPLAEVVHRELLRKKLNPVLKVLPPPGMERDFFACSDARQRTFIPASERALFGQLNGLIALFAPASLTHLKDVPPQRISEATRAKKPLREVLDRREERGRFGWTLCTYPTAELARQARLPLAEYARQIRKACFLDEADPVGRWRSVFKDCLEIKRWLKNLRIESLRVQSRSMDLELSLGERRRFLGVSGRNIPSFEVFTSPDWRGTRGVYYSDLPSFRSGNYVKGVRLAFEKGRVVRSSAASGAEFVRKTLATDEGAKRVGEFSLTDVRFSRIDRFMADTLFDENFGGRFGNCHIALGASYTDSYDGDPARLTKKAKERLGFNDSSLHWDLVNIEDKTVTAKLKGGKTLTIYEKGRFKC